MSADSLTLLVCYQYKKKQNTKITPTAHRKIYQDYSKKQFVVESNFHNFFY